MMAGGSAPQASLVQRTMAVLGAFDEHHRALRLSDIATRANLSRPTTLRIVRQLAMSGALRKRADHRYVIGRKLWRIGLLAPEPTGLRQLSSPYLQDLQAATRATVHLGVLDRDQVLYLDRLSGRTSVPVVSAIGGRLPLYATGVGKVLLAHAPPELQGHTLRNLHRITRYTITSPAVLRVQLDRIRRDGFATTAEEMTLGACSIAVPIRDQNDDVVASVGIVVPSLTRERARLSSALFVTTQGIRRELLTRAGEQLLASSDDDLE